jgi:hypothetical protein
MKVAKEGELYKRLVKNTDDFLKNKVSEKVGWPVAEGNNKIENYVNLSADTKKAIQLVEECALNCFPIVHQRILTALIEFIKLVQNNGSKPAKLIYANMNIPKLITRLLHKRPIVFYLANDVTYNREGIRCDGQIEKLSLFSEAKSAEKDVNITEYITYEEMLFSALIGVSNQTKFINKGERFNKGAITEIEYYYF